MNWMEAGCDDGDSNAHQRQATATMSSKKNIFICPLVPTALFSVCFNIASKESITKKVLYRPTSKTISLILQNCYHIFLFLFDFIWFPSSGWTKSFRYSPAVHIAVSNWTGHWNDLFLYSISIDLDLLLSYFLFLNPLWVGSFGNV